MLHIGLFVSDLGGLLISDQLKGLCAFLARSPCCPPIRKWLMPMDSKASHLVPQANCHVQQR